ncbi:D-alanyl-D-alanine carboxypeptidase [Ornithinibacillus sp. L9]|uniref:serine-type D-Ala-D-Ala carboxypeptidase n=2 Tax=Ornithinibacillus caprae TaxID=2678566 RepID=A0A6N8FEY6_9BACI|nr:serine hydrolase [Ornithinibacillus caprae]MUK88120.1 D-alanyl-D-alanine carboxypeptidase [Ornithinibacillus caprae]
MILVVFVLVASFITQPITASAAELDVQAEAAILVDFDTGKILYGKNIDEPINPASMAKMMTEYLVLEAIENGDISWETTTEISQYAFDISANSNYSGVGLRMDYEYNVRELYEAMAINSDNATTITLAELVAGSEGEFVKLMNQKAEELGLPEYKFVNSTGLKNNNDGVIPPEGTSSDEVNLMSAKSAALLAYRLIRDYPEVLDFSSRPTEVFDGQEIRNWNYMLPHNTTSLDQYYYEGIDGLKTGNTGDEKGKMFTGTALRNGKRLISVVMGTSGSSEIRYEETAKLMDYGYNNFHTKELFAAGYQIEGESSLPVAKGKEDTVEISINEGFSAPIEQGDEDSYTIEYHIDEDKLNESGELIAPIEKGEVIGTAELIYTGDNEYGYITGGSSHTVDLVTEDGVEKANWFMLTLSAVGNFFGNIFGSLLDTVKGWFS